MTRYCLVVSAVLACVGSAHAAAGDACDQDPNFPDTCCALTNGGLPCESTGLSCTSDADCQVIYAPIGSAILVTSDNKTVGAVTVFLVTSGAPMSALRVEAVLQPALTAETQAFCELHAATGPDKLAAAAARDNVAAFRVASESRTLQLRKTNTVASAQRYDVVIRANESVRLAHEHPASGKAGENRWTSMKVTCGRPDGISFIAAVGDLAWTAE